MRLRKRKTAKPQVRYSREDYICLECKSCGRLMENLSPDTLSIICSTCVQVLVGPPESPKKKAENAKPKGWALRKEFVDTDGTKYSFGKKVTNEVENTNASNTSVQQ